MVEDKKKEEQIENGLIDPKTVELDAKFKDSMDSRSVKGSLSIIWESMNYNFGKIRTTQHMNTQGIQKVAFDQKVLEHKIEEISVRQRTFKPKVEEHIKKEENEQIKSAAQWGLITKILGGTGTVIVVILALLQLFTIVGGL